MDVFPSVDPPEQMQELRPGALVEFDVAAVSRRDGYPERVEHLVKFGMLLNIQDSQRFGKEAIIFIAGDSTTTKENPVPLASVRSCPQNVRHAVIALLKASNAIETRSQFFRHALRNSEHDVDSKKS